jgi:hypothetical protein
MCKQERICTLRQNIFIMVASKTGFLQEPLENDVEISFFWGGLKVEAEK